MQIPITKLGSPCGEGFKVINLRNVLSSRTEPLPFALRIILENLLRQQLNGVDVKALSDALICWSKDTVELAPSLSVSRLMLPDSSGLPVLMDLAAAREYVGSKHGDYVEIEPKIPITLVIDHSLMVDRSGKKGAEEFNLREEYRRNRERYSFFKWAAQAFDNVKVVPPGAGIIHQIHLENLAAVIDSRPLKDGTTLIGSEFVLGCDSHTPMINGLGVLGWGVGGLEGEAAALGYPYVTNINRVIGLRLTGKLPPYATTTDLVLTITQKLRDFGVVGEIVEAFGPSLGDLSVPDRATISNMSPEFGATACFFPIDEQTITYLHQSGRSKDTVSLIEQYARVSGLYRENSDIEPEYSDVVEIDLAEVVPCVSGPKRPQDRVPLTEIKRSFREILTSPVNEGGFAASGSRDSVSVNIDGSAISLKDGFIAIAAITSCTNTSNPSVMLAAGILARNARARGLAIPKWVKTSLAPGSRLVAEYLSELGLMEHLEHFGFHVVGFGCTTCSGKSGPLNPKIVDAIFQEDLIATAVLSGNRNFEGRIHKAVRAAYLASPPLVIAFALAGRIDIDFDSDPIGTDNQGKAVYLEEIWPKLEEVDELINLSQKPERFRESYGDLYNGGTLWNLVDAPKGKNFPWDPNSTYIKKPPFFDNAWTSIPDMIGNLRVLVSVGDNLTTDYITPSGEIIPETPAGQYLVERNVLIKDFNAVTQRRGNHEFMNRVTFSNQRLKNFLVPEREGGWTRRSERSEVESIFSASEAYKADNVPLMIMAGRDYGMGSSRDWAAKGPRLLGVRLVLAESFERIHRSNLIRMGILPIIFEEGESAEKLGLTGFETFHVSGIHDGITTSSPLSIEARIYDKVIKFFGKIDVRNDVERSIILNGGIFGTLAGSQGG